MFIVYSRPNCSYCDRAKILLKQKNLSFVEIVVDSNTLEEFQTKTKNAKTVPQVFYGDNLIGGYTELAAEIEKWIE